MNNGYLKTNIHLWSYLAQFPLVWRMLQTKLAEKIKTHLIFNKSFWNSCRLWDTVDKKSRAKQVTDDSMGHAHCV